MIEFLPAAVSVAMTLGTVWVVSRTRHGWYVDAPVALDSLVPTDEQLQREREAYILLRTTWKPAPGSPLDWSLGLLQDECQKKIDARARPPAPRGTSATSRGREPTPPPPRGGSGQATASESTVHEQLHEIEQLYHVGALSIRQALKEINNLRLGDQEAIRQLRADTDYVHAVTKQLRKGDQSWTDWGSSTPTTN